MLTDLVHTIHDLEPSPAVHHATAKLQQVWARELQSPQRGQPWGGCIQKLLHWNCADGRRELKESGGVKKKKKHREWNHWWVGGEERRRKADLPKSLFHPSLIWPLKLQATEAIVKARHPEAAESSGIMLTAGTKNLHYCRKGLYQAVLF